MRWLVLLVLVVPFGCKSVPASYLKAAPPAQIEQGWVPFRKANLGATFALPAGWEIEDVKTFKSDLFRSGGLTPSLFPTSASLEALKEKPEDEVELIGMGTAGTNFGMLKATKKVYSRNQDVEAVADKERSTYNANSGVSDLQVERIDLPVGKTVRVKAILKSIGGIKPAITSYTLVDGTSVYNFMFMGLDETGQSIPTRQIMRSFRLINPHKG